VNVVQILKFPIGLAALSIIPVWVLNNGASVREFTFWVTLAGAAGFAVNAATATFRRYQVLGNDARSLRTYMSILSSLGWCVLGLYIAALCWGHLSYILSSEYYNPVIDSPGIPGTLALMILGFLGVLCGASGLLYLQHPSLRCYRTVNLIGFTTIATILGWSLVSYGPAMASVKQTHAVGAGLGAILFTVALPLLTVCLMLLHLWLIRTLRILVSFDDHPEAPA
jgi:hypothetical protein